jgi:catechol 2,3-dioxygenase-like lactoylglutathione lyase family enzyme
MESLLTDIDHVAIAVHDIDAAIAWYADTLGAQVVHREDVVSDGICEALIKVGDSYIQLLTPTREDSTVAAFLEAVKATGARVIDEVPRPGSRSTTIAFVHPKTSFGTLIELVEESTLSH